VRFRVAFQDGGGRVLIVELDPLGRLRPDQLCPRRDEWTLVTASTWAGLLPQRRDIMASAQSRGNFLVAASLKDNDLPPERARRRTHVVHLLLEHPGRRTAGKIGDRSCLGQHLAQQFEPFARKLNGNKRYSRDVATRLVTRPYVTGSVPPARTIGIVSVARFAANAVAAEPNATITLTRRRTRSAASSPSRCHS
jgi:hypothetical protein